MKTPDAGKAIASGGYGCVFKPPIVCNDDSFYDPMGISKLMLKKDAYSELKEIELVKKMVKNIKNNQDYFILDGINICQPGELSEEDKINFDNKCKNLLSRSINKNNVNLHLHNLRIINIPYGGLDIEKYWNEWNKLPIRYKGTSFIATNSSLINLLVNAIVPLNNDKILHMDIKGPNILRSGEINSNINIYTRLIDWGLALKYKSLPKQLEDRVIIFNNPFSSILFDSTLNTWIPSPDEVNYNSIAEMIIIYNEHDLGKGHMEYILWMIKNIFKNNQDFKNFNNSEPKNVIINYISAVLKKYLNVHTGQFEKEKYFIEVFSKNVDVWGFLMSYFPLVTFETKIKKDIENILIEYCFSPDYAAEVIPIKEIVDKLTNINNKYKKHKLKIISNTNKFSNNKTIINKTNGNKTNGINKRKTKKLKIVEVGAKKSFEWSGKRCPKGTRRNKKTGKCSPK